MSAQLKQRKTMNRNDLEKSMPNGFNKPHGDVVAVFRKEKDTRFIVRNPSDNVDKFIETVNALTSTDGYEWIFHARFWNLPHGGISLQSVQQWHRADVYGGPSGRHIEHMEEVGRCAVAHHLGMDFESGTPIR